MSEENKEPIAEKPLPSNPPVESSLSLIDKADAVALRMENANKKAEELIIRQEEIIAKRMLAGRAEGNFNPKTPEEIQKDEVNRRAQEMIKRFK